MKYWKLFFLCLTLNSCIKKDTVQDSVQKTELQNMQKSLFQNYACLATFIEIAQIIKYNGIEDDTKYIKHLNFWCNCSKENLENNKNSIKESLNKKIIEQDFINNELKRKYNNDSDFNKTILQMYSNKKPEDEIVVILSEVIKKYISKSEEFFANLKPNLDGYKKSVHSGGAKYNIEAFDKLFGYLKKLCEDYRSQIELLNDEQVVSCFFSNFLIQFYNVYYENIYRTKENDNGTLKMDLSFISSID